eukprot:101375-Pelagomonas_calceolata.AAC.3
MGSSPASWPAWEPGVPGSWPTRGEALPPVQATHGTPPRLLPSKSVTPRPLRLPAQHRQPCTAPACRWRQHQVRVPALQVLLHVRDGVWRERGEVHPTGHVHRAGQRVVGRGVALHVVRVHVLCPWAGSRVAGSTPACVACLLCGAMHFQCGAAASATAAFVRGASCWRRQWSCGCSAPVVFRRGQPHAHTCVRVSVSVCVYVCARACVCASMHKSGAPSTMAK